MHLRPTGSPCERIAKGHQHREAWQQDYESYHQINFERYEKERIYKA